MSKKTTDETQGLSLSDFEISDYINPDENVPIDSKGLSRRAKEALNMEQVRQALFLHGRDGLTALEIAGFVGISEPTSRKHLEKLCSIREAYSIMRKASLRLYYPNGEPLHGLGRYRIEEGPHIIESVLARGPNDRLFLHVTEKRFSILEGEKTEGGVLVPMEIVRKFIEHVKKLIEKGGLIETR